MRILLLVLSSILTANCFLAGNLDRLNGDSIDQENFNSTWDNIPEARIANGAAAINNQFPFMVSILMPMNNGHFTVCGGSIISRMWVLTAAHCTRQGRQYNLRYGSINLMNGGETQTSFHALPHQNFNPNTLQNDISIIRIPRPLTFSLGVQIIRLPNIRQVNFAFTDHPAVVAGWGMLPQGTMANRLKFVNMIVANNALCQNFFANGNVPEQVLCATGRNNMLQGHCAGDDGGPIFIREGPNWTQVGIASFSARTRCGVRSPSGYTRTSRYLNWISMYAGVPIRR